MNEKKYTSVGTDINEVKKLNARSGLSYNQVLELLAKEDTEFSEEQPTNKDQIREKANANRLSKNN